MQCSTCTYSFNGCYSKCISSRQYTRLQFERHSPPWPLHYTIHNYHIWFAQQAPNPVRLKEWRANIYIQSFQMHVRENILAHFSTPLFCACAASDHTALLKCLLLLSLLLLFWETHVNSSQKLSSIHPNRSLLHALRMDMPRSKTTNKILQFSAESRQSALYVYLMAVKWMLLLCSEKIFNSHLSDKSRLAKCWYELTNTHRKQKKTARVIWSCLIFIYKYNAKKTKVSLHRILDISDIYK